MGNSPKMRASLFRCASAMALTVCTVGAMTTTPAAAQDAARRSYSVPAGDLTTALTQFGQQSGMALVYQAEVARGKSTNGVSGSFTPEEALSRVLAGTGLSFRFNGVNTIAIEAQATNDGERVLGAVRIEGAEGSGLAGATAANGINGSRDVTATEGTGSYTSNALTIGSKTAASIKDTSMAVSVLTNQQMQDQNITDLNSAMRNLPGVTLVHSNSGQYDFYSRGFQITQIQFDGGAAMSTQLRAGGLRYNSMIDMSLYDHAEIVRGAAGTFNAYGNPGGIVNLVRKKPLDHTQILVEAQLGSWDWYRASVDITGPLAFDGHLRGRLIATHQDNRYFYDIAKANRDLISATLEYDLTPTTLVSVGTNYQESRDLPFSNGLMRYQNGDSLDLPRSTCFCFSFARDNSKNFELFGQVEQGIGSNWTAKFKATRVRQNSEFLQANITGAVNPYTLSGPTAAVDNPYYPRVRQTMFEGTIDGHFRLFGNDQKLIIGGNYSVSDSAGSFNGVNSDIMTYQPLPFPNRTSNDVNVFSFNSSEWLRPAYPDYNSISFLKADYSFINFYASLDFTPIKRFHANIGLRYSKFKSTSLVKYLCYDLYTTYDIFGCASVGTGNFSIPLYGTVSKGSDFSWPPSVQWRYDITDNLTASAIYTDIYIDQSQFVDRDRKPIAPITGGNFEGALKWVSPDKRLNITASGFYIRQKGGQKRDCNYPWEAGIPGAPACVDSSSGSGGQIITQSDCCYISNPKDQKISYGSDIEITGEIKKGWQISANYTFNRTYIKLAETFDGQRPPLQSYAPRHKFQLWTSYNFDDRTRLPGLTLGFGAQIQSSTFTIDSYCTQFGPNQDTGLQECKDSKNVYFTEPGRVVLSGSVGYKLNDHLRLDLQMENLLDKTYYEQVGGINNGNWYGAPRSAKLTVRGKF
jgi:outer-membrane receptor for ferric coprogen and ferric-rhodotorulic acid